MADPCSVEARRRLKLAVKGKIAADKKPAYDALFQQLKDEGFQPPVQPKTTPPLAGGRPQLPRSGAPKPGTMGEDMAYSGAGKIARTREASTGLTGSKHRTGSKQQAHSLFTAGGACHGLPACVQARGQAHGHPGSKCNGLGVRLL